MIGRTYNRQKKITRDDVWERATAKAESQNQHPTAEEFVEEVLNEIRASCIEIHEDYVPVEFDERRDEVYYSRSKRPLIGHSEDTIWFKTGTEDFVVRNRLSRILDSFNVNLGLVSSEQIEDGVVKYEIKVPFIGEDERQQNIREDTVDIARELREYKDVDEEDVVGDCPRDGCDGKRYQNGMGSCGPKYECTRFGCGFQFVRDVL